MSLTIHKKVVIGHIFTKRNCSTSVVSQVEDSGLDTKPVPHVSSEHLQDNPKPLPSQIPRQSHRYVSNHQTSAPLSIRRIPNTSHSAITHVFPLAGKPTGIITIRPEWKSRPDSVLYNCAGARSAFSGKSWIASTNVDDLRRNWGELATISAVLTRC